MKRPTVGGIALMVICGLFALSVFSQGQEAEQLAATHVEVIHLPAAIVLYRSATGPYSQHPVVFDELMKYVGANYRAVGACFGVYPHDPDATRTADLKWEVGVRVIPGAPLGYGKNLPIEELPNQSAAGLKGLMLRMKTPAEPYKLRIQEETTAAVLESTVERAPQDGLALFPWMAKNGYVQIGPTRMEYLSHEGPPSQIKVRIILPVKIRESGLKTPS
jgi:hypothetical protein